jgi:hypothetical protein
MEDSNGELHGTTREVKDQYEIDTGVIFSNLQGQYKRFDPLFLQTKVQEALQATLLKKGFVSYRRSKGEESYFERIHKEYFSFKATDNNFPFPAYFINGDTSIEYAEPCILKRQDPHFDLFFALNLSLILPRDVRPFLGYQLQSSFKGDQKSFSSFLSDLVITYSFIPDTTKRLIEAFLKEVNTNGTPSLEEQVEQASKEFTTQRQCLAVYYLLMQCGAINEKTGEPKEGITKNDIIELIHFLTGKNRDNVKKAFSTMLGKGSETAYHKKPSVYTTLF